jgi:serine/threonine protein kinase
MIDSGAHLIGRHVGNYRLMRLLGQGGFANVYLGEHIHLGTQAAIKVLHTQITFHEAERFRSEARMIANLDHPHIIRVLDFGLEGTTPFLVMSYATGGSLRLQHREGIPLPISLVVSSVKQIADALQYAHERKLIHHDVKPDNILLDERKNLLLSDFGIALILQTSRSESTHASPGTIAYMAPEQSQGHPLPASDQYALGIMTFEWLCGVRPFQGTFMELLAQHAMAPVPSLREVQPSVSLAIERVVQRALAKEPQQRFPSVKDFAEALEQASHMGESMTSIRVKQSQQLPGQGHPSKPAVHLSQQNQQYPFNQSQPSVPSQSVSKATNPPLQSLQTGPQSGPRSSSATPAYNLPPSFVPPAPPNASVSPGLPGGPIYYPYPYPPATGYASDHDTAQTQIILSNLPDRW